MTIPGYLAQRSPVWLALHQVLDRWRQLLWQLMGTTMVSQMDLLFAPAFAWVLCAPKYLDGTMPLGELTQASAAFVTLQVAFNWLVDNFQRFSDWQAATTRVAALLSAFDQVEGTHKPSPPSPSTQAGARGDEAARGVGQAESKA